MPTLVTTGNLAPYLFLSGSIQCVQDLERRNSVRRKIGTNPLISRLWHKDKHRYGPLVGCCCFPEAWSLPKRPCRANCAGRSGLGGSRAQRSRPGNTECCHFRQPRQTRCTQGKCMDHDATCLRPTDCRLHHDEMPHTAVAALSWVLPEGGGGVEIG